MVSKLSRTSMAAALAVALAAAVTAVGFASTSQASGAKVVRITSVAAQQVFPDVAPTDEFSVGDSFVFSEDLFRGTKGVGDAGGECTTVRIDAATAVAHCTETFRLPEGQIVAQGLVTFDPAVGGTEFTWAITGGTGAYRMARGEVGVVETNGGENATFEFRITR